MRLKVAGTQGGKLYGLTPTGKRIEVPEIGSDALCRRQMEGGLVFRRRARVLMLQLNALHMLEA
jgi:hypothetical protein